MTFLVQSVYCAFWPEYECLHLAEKSCCDIRILDWRLGGSSCRPCCGVYATVVWLYVLFGEVKSMVQWLVAPHIL